MERVQVQRREQGMTDTEMSSGSGEVQDLKKKKGGGTGANKGQSRDRMANTRRLWPLGAECMP